MGGALSPEGALARDGAARSSWSMTRDRTPALGNGDRTRRFLQPRPAAWVRSGATDPKRRVGEVGYNGSDSLVHENPACRLYHTLQTVIPKEVTVADIDERQTENRTRWGLATRAAHAAMARNPGVARPLVQPLFQSTVFAFDSVEQVDEVYQKSAPGHVYYRMGTPNTTALERSIAELESGEDAVAAASGMGVISAALFALVRSGDHLVADRHAYGGTHTLVTQDLPRLGVEATLVDVADRAALARAIRPNTRAILVETLSNPTLRVSNIPAICQFGQSQDIPVIVDNTLDLVRDLRRFRRREFPSDEGRRVS